jgi:hypothetical protein
MLIKSQNTTFDYVTRQVFDSKSYPTLESAQIQNVNYFMST